MLTLCLDCSQNVTALALLQEQKLLAGRLLKDQTVSSALLFHIDLLLKEQNANLADIQHIIYGIGPGSFTSLRVGASVLWGLFGLRETPISFWGVSSLLLRLQSLAPNALEKTCVAFPARAQKFYVGFYDKNGQFYEACLSKDELQDKENSGWTVMQASVDPIQPSSFEKIDLKSASYDYFLNKNINLNYLQPKEDIAKKRPPS